MYREVNFIFLNICFVYSKKWSSKNITKKWGFECCSTSGQKTITGSLFAALLVFPEVSFSVLML